MDSEAVRSAALIAASSAVPRGTSAPDLTEYAGQLIPWITQPPAVRLDVTVALDGRLIAHTSNGGDMAFSATPGVNQKFDVTVLPKDAGENTTGDPIGFSTDDPGGTILTPSVSADGRTVAPGAHKIELTVEAVDDEKVVRHEQSTFIVPR